MKTTLVWLSGFLMAFGVMALVLWGTNTECHFDWATSNGACIMRAISIGFV
jgi:hypothetical protein